MKRQFRASELLLVIGLSLILLFMLAHDWVPLGQLNDVKAVKDTRPTSELVMVTLIGSVQIALLLVLTLRFAGRTYPLWAKLWLVIHQSCIFAGALLDWWIPYLSGFGAANKVESYRLMFGNTHVFLPIRNGIVPNTLHVIFHLTLLLCILLSIYICFVRPASKQHAYS